MYSPSQEILTKYANLLVNFALGGGEGIKPKQTVFIQGIEAVKPLLFELQGAVLKAGAYPIVTMTPNETERNFMDFSRQYLELANDDQLDFFPDKYIKGKVDQMDHIVAILGTVNKHNLEGIAPEKIMRRKKTLRPYLDWRTDKENAGKLTWTLALYGTEEMAKGAGMSPEEYWQEIINACYLDESDPIAKWKELQAEIDRLKTKLDNLKIQSVRVVAQETDLVVGLGDNRTWLGGSGRNIPSFEIFISPQCYKTEGHIYFNVPLYSFGTEIKDIRLEFKAGKIVKATASQGESVLNEMLKVKGANMIGEFSLTDTRLSRITKPMGETLYDENLGGEFGNTHVAFGNAYKDSYPGGIVTVSKEKWAEMGYNESAIHTDVFSTLNREVTATLEDGSKLVIYKDGKFTI